jgi:hypothetical protein
MTSGQLHSPTTVSLDTAVSSPYYPLDRRLVIFISSTDTFDWVYDVLLL